MTGDPKSAERGAEKVLVTGAEGFAGHHLVDLLASSLPSDITAACFAEPARPFPPSASVTRMDITSEHQVEQFFRSRGPFDTVYHLAGLSSVGLSWKEPAKALLVNSIGTMNLLEAVRRSGRKTKFLYVSTAEVYEAGQQGILSEESPVKPENPYAISKFAAEQSVIAYGKVFSLPVFIARPVTHTGPGQSAGFAIIDFCRQALALKKGRMPRPHISAGNIDVLKDYCDVRDVVSAYALIVSKSPGGEVFNISSGRRTSLRKIIEIIKKTLKTDFEVVKDPSRMRPYDPDMMVLSNDKIVSLGWTPRYLLEDTIRDVIESLSREGSAAP
jgi:GDP-4-dehydro-6-deoxy-D-mannose reductase